MVRARSVLARLQRPVIHSDDLWLDFWLDFSVEADVGRVGPVGTLPLPVM